MTKPWSEPGDNEGRCEACDDPSTVGQAQEAYPLKMADGYGGFVNGTLWLCPTCLRSRQERDA